MLMTILLVKLCVISIALAVQGSGIMPYPVIHSSVLPKTKRRHYAPAPLDPGSSVSLSYSPSPSPVSHVSPVPSQSPIAASPHTKTPSVPPKISSPGSSSKMLPPPPSNEECSAIRCTEPYTNTPLESLCGCVRPMQIGLHLNVPLYSFFPFVLELAKEIAAGVSMKQSQVRIIGANAANQQPEKTVVLIDLVPMMDKFDNTKAFLTYEKFWHNRVKLNSSYFGDYEVLYVHYPGLPSSPPLAPSGITILDNGPFFVDESKRVPKNPFGVDLPKRQKKDRIRGSIIAIISLSAFVVLLLCSVTVWFTLFQHRHHDCHKMPTPRDLKPSGMTTSMIGILPSSSSPSFASSIATYTGSAKTFSTSEIEKATDNFNDSRIIGEGGFGRVYSGILEGGTKVAVKVLKRNDHQGGREFMAEVEMLSRLHHRNLLKLIGICTEERNRCLVYELIPNGSVESHLHGDEKESAPLDWDARMKIALGAARGLAYLHEDSSPCVIHRDFKSSNILLEHDFTPKVSDFGLARTAMDEDNAHISTRVMGTFGYVAPEYAMTGHLLVKSDVYSYGVVLLELLTGRKPIDMSQPPGKENLVAFARPLLTSKDGVEAVLDTSLQSNLPFDSIAKVAAIASMCVQPEVTHRPFMGEVVQALKLVCNEHDETKEIGSRNSSRDNLSVDMDAMIRNEHAQMSEPSQFSGPRFDFRLDVDRGLSVSEMFNTSARFGRQESESFRQHSSSGPLPTARSRQFCQGMRRLSGGSVSEHGFMVRSWPGSH